MKMTLCRLRRTSCLVQDTRRPFCPEDLKPWSRGQLSSNCISFVTIAREKDLSPLAPNGSDGSTVGALLLKKMRKNCLWARPANLANKKCSFAGHCPRIKNISISMIRLWHMPRLEINQDLFSFPENVYLKSPDPPGTPGPQNS